MGTQRPITFIPTRSHSCFSIRWLSTWFMRRIALKTNHILSIAFKEIGFVCLVNHGLPKEKVGEIFDWVRTLLASRESTLRRWSHS